MDSVEAARDDLGAPSVERRRTGARTLFVRARDDPEQVSEAAEALREVLNDEDPVVRGHALATLSALADPPGEESSTPVDPPYEALVEGLTDPSGRVRQTAVGLLSEPGSTPPEPLRPDAAAGLLAALSDDSDLVRLRAAETLSAAAVSVHPDPGDAVEGLLAALEDDRTDVRTNAGETLAGLAIDHPDLLTEHGNRLRSLLEAPEADVRATAGFALAALDHDDEAALRVAVQGLCDLLPVEERWAGAYWMRKLLQQWIRGRPTVVASAIESHEGTPPDLERIARRIRGRN